ncbi:MAG: hypothetical protein ACRDYZ_15710 [Acidimicrobiales bacterium]
MSVASNGSRVEPHAGTDADFAVVVLVVAFADDLDVTTAGVVDVPLPVADGPEVQPAVRTPANGMAQRASSTRPGRRRPATECVDDRRTTIIRPPSGW